MFARHDALIRDWKNNAHRRENANFRLLRSLKMADDPDEIDRSARRLHDEVFGRIDCTRCANCCKTVAPTLNEIDIQRIAGRQKLTPQEFIDASAFAVAPVLLSAAVTTRSGSVGPTG
jgi:hypothetical protein